MWIVPATRTKAKREHRVPLGRRALEVLDTARSLDHGHPLVFPSVRGKRMNDIGTAQGAGGPAVPHGFRSTFRDRAAEETNHPREVVEAALAHVIQNKVEAAYARSDLFDRRRRLMEDWAAYVGGAADGPLILRTGRRPCWRAGGPGATPHPLAVGVPLPDGGNLSPEAGTPGNGERGEPAPTSPTSPPAHRFG